MSFEVGAFREEEIKKRKLSEKEKQEEIDKRKRKQEEVKEKVDVFEKSDKNLQELKELVEKGLISKDMAEKIADSSAIIESSKIEEIFEKIDEIEDIKDVDKYLPPHLRITKEEYKKALIDPIFRIQTLTKLNTALTLIADQINSGTGESVNIFSGFLTMLDKNLKLVQENTIDVRDSLEEVEEKENPKPKKSLWQIIKEIFVSA